MSLSCSDTSRLFQINREFDDAEAVAAERALLSREIHDGVAQYISALSIVLRTATEQLAAEPSGNVTHLVATAREYADLALAECRFVIAQRDPGEGADLAERMRHLAELFARASTANTSIDIAIADSEISVAAQHVIYRVVTEALSNCLRHSQASDATVSVNSHGTDQVRIVVSDNGAGFAADEQLRLGSHGLSAMRRRIADAGGWVWIATNPGEGTRVEAVLPTGTAVAMRAG